MRKLCAILAILCPACGLFAAYDMRNQPTAALDGWKIEAEAARPDAVCRSGETVEFRVRLLKGCARIQVPEGQLELVLKNRETILERLRQWYAGVVLDLEVRP